MKVQGSRIKNGLVLCSVSRATYFYLHFVRVVRTVFCATTVHDCYSLQSCMVVFRMGSTFFIAFFSVFVSLLATGAGIALSSSDILCEYAGDVAIAHKFAAVEIGRIDVICWLNDNRNAVFSGFHVPRFSCF